MLNHARKLRNNKYLPLRSKQTLFLVKTIFISPVLALNEHIRNFNRMRFVTVVSMINPSWFIEWVTNHYSKQYELILVAYMLHPHVCYILPTGVLKDFICSKRFSRKNAICRFVCPNSTYHNLSPHNHVMNMIVTLSTSVPLKTLKRNNYWPPPWQLNGLIMRVQTWVW